MESSGLAGEIQVSEAVYKTLSGEYDLTHRGQIEIKGKGLMNTYLLGEKATSGSRISTPTPHN
jgi:hypothetical protein